MPRRFHSLKPLILAVAILAGFALKGADGDAARSLAHWLCLDHSVTAVG